MAPVLEQLAAQVAGKAKIVKAKVDDAQDAAAGLGIFGLPTFVFFRDGKEVDRQMGTASLDKLKAKIDKAAG